MSNSVVMTTKAPIKSECDSDSESGKFEEDLESSRPDINIATGIFDSSSDSDADSGLLKISNLVEKLNLSEKKERKGKRPPTFFSSSESQEDEGNAELLDTIDQALKNKVLEDESDSDSDQEQVDEDPVPAHQPRDHFSDLPEAAQAGPSFESPLHQIGVHNVISKLLGVIQSIPKEDVFVENPPGLRVDLYDHQRYGLTWLSWREEHFPGGGILADEMGLGKTIMIIALVLKSKAERGTKKTDKSKNARNKVPSRTTLVVVPPSVMGQWEEEIKKKSRGMKVYCYHGPKRTSSVKELVQNDFVLTTYQTLGSDIPKQSEEKYEDYATSPLLRIHWERIVLDEGHAIRNPSTLIAQAACRLTASHRWIVTGTPVHNKPADLHSLVKFLGLIPFDDAKVWNSWIGLKAVAPANVERLRIVGKSLILRRTKEEVKLGGGNVQSIPPKTVIDVKIRLGPDEQNIYDYLREYAEKQFKKFLKNHQSAHNDLEQAADNFVAGGRPMGAPNGAADINYSLMFTLLLRLRQASVLPYLITTMLEDEDDDDDNLFDPSNDLYSRKNPVFSKDFQSAKLKQLYEDLEALRQKGRDEGVPMEKVVVVSQWTSLLDVVCDHLEENDFSTTSITGKVKVSERMTIMKRFNNNPEKPQIMLLSLTAGGVGLNLTGANHLFFLDIHWNPQLEIQAQDRIHRFGQTKDVTVKRYISEDTMEERVVGLQNSKLDLANGILSYTKNKGGAGLSLGDMRKLFEM